MSTSQRPRPPGTPGTPGSPSRPGPRRPAPAPAAAGRPAAPPAPPLSEQDIDELQGWLDRVPAPLEPLDVGMLDGFLCGVLLQPERIPDATWLAHVTDADGRALPPRFDASRLHALAIRRHRELNDAIGRRQWFDPWVFELDEADAAEPADRVHADTRSDAALRVLSAQDGDSADTGNGSDEGDAPPEVAAVYPWVAGFATAQEFFPGLMRLDASALTEPLALLYRHLDPDDLEDADALIEEIESLEPPADLTEAVEGLVRATLLLADVSRPVNTPNPSARPPSRGAPRGTPRRR